MDWENLTDPMDLARAIREVDETRASARTQADRLTAMADLAILATRLAGALLDEDGIG